MEATKAEAINVKSIAPSMDVSKNWNRNLLYLCALKKDMESWLYAKE